jgi:hypothetical protein
MQISASSTTGSVVCAGRPLIITVDETGCRDLSKNTIIEATSMRIDR